MMGGHRVPEVKAIDRDAVIDAPSPESAAPTNGAGHAVDDAAQIARLAKLPLLDYARERKAAAKSLGCPVGMLDAAVKAVRSEAGVAGQGRALELPECEPWPEPVNGAVLLDAITRAMREYVILSDAQASAVALWNTYTHVYDAGDTNPKLIVKSPQKRSGKTRLAEVLERTTSRPLLLSGISPAALLRVIEKHHPTLLLDEMDAAMKQDREMAEAMRGIINSGFNRSGARFVKNVSLPDGGYQPCAFSTWCPQMLAGIGDLPETVRDRSIEIDMQRKLPTEKVKRLRQRDGDDLRVIARMSARWGADNMDELRAARPAAPPGLNDRAADAWEPLFAIADLAGGDWPLRARKAALVLSGDAVVDDDNIGTMLLAAIQAAFHQRTTDQLPSSDLTTWLHADKDGPWVEFGKARKPITQNMVAKLLKPYRIRPCTIRVGMSTPKGYRLEQFTDAFTHYLPTPPNQTATPQQMAGNLTSPDFFNPQHTPPCCGSESAENSNISAGCGGVAVAKEGAGDSRGKNVPEEAPDQWEHDV